MLRDDTEIPAVEVLLLTNIEVLPNKLQDKIVREIAVIFHGVGIDLNVDGSD